MISKNLTVNRLDDKLVGIERELFTSLTIRGMKIVYNMSCHYVHSGRPASWYHDQHLLLIAQDGLSLKEYRTVIGVFAILQQRAETDVSDLAYFMNRLEIQLFNWSLGLKTSMFIQQ